MYLYFDDSSLCENYYWRLPTGLEIGILWYTRRTPSTIYATAKAIIRLLSLISEFESQTEGMDIPAR
jgi:hypothetical protein